MIRIRSRGARRQSANSPWRPLASVCLIGVALAACGVVDAYRIDPVIANAEPGVVCPSGLGSYALPKAFIHVVVARTGVTAAPDIISTKANTAVEVLRHPDPKLVFCLDYLASPLSHDTITVKKSPASGGTPDQKNSFLGAVMVNAQDRTVYIVESLLRAAFIAASGNSGFTPRDIAFGTSGLETLADLEYDPFDPRESAEVNARLADLGVCLVLEAYTFDRTHTDVDHYCSSPRAHAAWSTMFTKAYLKAEATAADPLLPGLLYRPRIPFRISIYRKPNPGGGGRWKLSETQQVALENKSPVLSLDIRHAAFAGRNANFVFADGALTVACVAKNSETEGFVEIPLQISKSLVALPASIVSVQFNQTANQTALTNAESQLYQVQQAYLSALSSGKAFAPPSGTPSTLPTQPAPPSDYTALPTDLAPATSTASPPAPVYGADIFGAKLDALCQGTT